MRFHIGVKRNACERTLLRAGEGARKNALKNLVRVRLDASIPSNNKQDLSIHSNSVAMP
jgi:hypothetical protein